MATMTRSLLARGYASAAASVKLTSLSGTYATSTYLAAARKSSKELDAVAKDLQGLEKRLKEDAQVKDFLKNPTLTDVERKKVIDSLAPSSSASPILSNLLKVLASNGRLSLFPSIITDFATLMSAHRGELVVTITSAEPLGSGEMKRLEKALKASQAAQGKDLKLVNKVNEGILGGLQVDFGDKTIDLSASSRVTKFGAALTESI
ncbi:hypothetical protein QFC20_001405 [Naganishia adeliensis]|uniref:Uncharacterized protein n=1 Tax=Naganishia adeliensis TaxID=92952 RepID=A0ACC2WSC5_9TREE|nr:hypothetical protein QFC20_001405 [Naganishia adeliensis]